MSGQDDLVTTGRQPCYFGRRSNIFGARTIIFPYHNGSASGVQTKIYKLPSGDAPGLT
jgi:hypothetical protein